jgi:hypothetical protein
MGTIIRAALVLAVIRAIQTGAPVVVSCRVTPELVEDRRAADYVENLLLEVMCDGTGCGVGQ